jgi:predicted transcriptional regulator
MGKRIDEKTIEQIPVLYEQYQNKAEVARQLGISSASVNKYLAVYNGAPVEVVAKKRVKIDEELIAQINEKYKACKNMA